ncbi:OB-fold putative lipoprotein [Polaribacter sp. MSW13]|uniref:OB-fold putative lipoprotein n=1 Tax=Polaribacter marinus TaxID=2916838 RepID=A0A9X1VUZ2_9FLAO|nr:OB-fold putative lipoprotein [Polaribacter marinus]MCI2230041.1 OB-fold putative lipoprotein [Polaribacter marinus]
MSIRKKIIIILGIGIIIAGIIVVMMFFKPHRDVQNTATDFRYKASEIVNEYLADADKANNKYLDEEGNSKILEIEGMVAQISEDFNHQKVILLKSTTDKAGVSCTFTQNTNSHTTSIKTGDIIIVKGVIRSGATFDEDLDMYENIILEKCDIITQ